MRASPGPGRPEGSEVGGPESVARTGFRDSMRRPQANRITKNGKRTLSPISSLPPSEQNATMTRPLVERPAMPGESRQDVTLLLQAATDGDSHAAGELL